jgi:hypothetical protein
MALWGNTDLVYSNGTIDVNLGTNTITGTAGIVTFTNSGIRTGDVVTVGTGATYGYAIVTGFTSTTISIADTSNFVSGLTTVAGASYYVSQEPVYSLKDSNYRAPEAKTVGYSTSPVTTGVYGVDYVEVGAASTTQYAVGHSGWVGIMTYIDTHGNLRVKHEVLVAGGILTTSTSDNNGDDGYFPGT